jgi:tetraacyldisaccharide 4'-kinase
MVSEAPPFWWKKGDLRAWLLAPASLIYGYFAGRNMRNARRAEVDVPVICVGNFTVGGAGKTPTVITLARAAKARGLKPGVLSRGYGGSMDRTTIVDPDHHRAHDVGDEPLLIAREALTVITRRRLDGARTLIENGADLIIMDDGFQSAALKFDYALMVIDSVRGIGNGFLVPAGPVRAPTALQLTYSTALLKLGDGDAADPFIRSAARSGKPIYEGMVRPVGDTAAAIEGSRVLAFAGIADPKKFYRTVKALGAEIVAKRSFGDHQHLTDDEIADILSTAEKKELDIVTTAKDAARLRGHHGAAEELLARITVIDVEMAFDAPNTARQIINEAYENFRKRRLAAKKG